MEDRRRSPSIRWRLLLILPILLLACDFGTIGAPPLPLPTATPVITFIFSPLPATPTLNPSATDTTTPTDTLTETPTVPSSTATETATITITETPTPTINLYPHVFPIQPPEMAGFSPGGHAYPATDIFAPIGTNFVAVTNGVIDEVSYEDQWDPLTNDNANAGGLWVRILGDDGLRYYGAHLSKIAYGIKPGMWVAAGTVLGLTGNSGNAQTSTPHLHFEISSPLPPFTKVDPYPLLLAWLGGQNLTPPLPTP